MVSAVNSNKEIDSLIPRDYYTNRIVIVTSTLFQTKYKLYANLHD